MRKIFSLMIILALFSVPTLAQDNDDESEAVLIDVAFLTSISIDDSDGIQITINGELLDACTELGEITQFVEGDVITVEVLTIRPADAMCAMVISAFEEVYTLDTSELDAGDYTLTVNDISEDITIIASANAESVETTPEADILDMTCPEATDDSELFESFGMCFLYPSENDIFIGNDFALISQPLTSNALLLIQVSDADNTDLEDINDEFGDLVDLVIDDITIARQDSLILESETSREAYIIFNERLYHFVIQPINDTNGELLWAEVINSLFFPEPEED